MYLKTLPVDFLKIDGHFVREINIDPLDRAMVTAIHSVGHAAGIATIAEWVEHEAALEVLRAIGVDYVQGFATASPCRSGVRFSAWMTSARLRVKSSRLSAWCDA